MIKKPDEKTVEAIVRLRNVTEFKEILWYLRNLALFNHNALPNCVGDDTLRRQGELQALDALYKHLAGKEVFDGPA